VTPSGNQVAHYLDTSALVKLVVDEAETDALRAWISAEPSPLVACDLARTELLRAVRRVADGPVLQARAVLDAITLVAVSAATFESAGRLDPTALRTLDAIRVAAALELGDDLASIVTYDTRLAAGAQANGIPVTAPT
jgi:uncharacterized protein